MSTFSNARDSKEDSQILREQLLGHEDIRLIISLIRELSGSIFNKITLLLVKQTLSLFISISRRFYEEEAF